MVCVGLLMVSCSSILTRFGLPDFFHGFIIGLGLAMELVGVVSIMRRKRCAADTESSVEIRN